jgi:serine phosphatase RsbU (regulator of sigma subunit)
VIDCTGHGVPGALLSIMGYRLLNEALIMHNITQPSKIFEYLNQSLIYELQQKKNNNRDGMDITLCSIEYTENDNINVVFSGAGLPIYFFRKNMNSVEKIKGSRKKIGGILSINSDLEYTDTYFNLNKGDIIYLASDGWVDQCNQNRKRIGSEAFMNVIQKNALLPIQQQQLAFDSTLKDFQETTPQRDDITIWGIKL